MRSKETYGQLKSALKMIGKILSWATFALLIIIAGALIFYVVSVKMYESRGEKYEPPFELYTIISPSMQPTIKVYDVILNTRVKSVDQLKEGDVITFVSTSSLTAGMTITHRIDEVIETEDGIKFRTKGDNNLTSDSSLVTKDDILGKVALKIPQLGRIQFLLASKSGWIFIIVIPALCVIIYDILKIFKLVGVKEKVAKLDQEEIDIEKEEQERKRKEKLKDQLSQKQLSPEEDAVFNKIVEDAEANFVIEDDTTLNVIEEEETEQLLLIGHTKTLELDNKSNDQQLIVPKKKRKRRKKKKHNRNLYLNNQNQKNFSNNIEKEIKSNFNENHDSKKDNEDDTTLELPKLKD